MGDAVGPSNELCFSCLGDCGAKGAGEGVLIPRRANLAMELRRECSAQPSSGTLERIEKH